MKVRDKAYPSGETALILRQALGIIRSWDDALTDMRIGKTTVFGHVLVPRGRLFCQRAWRPAYVWQDIKEFILKVTAASAEAKARLPPQGRPIEYDPDVPWRFQKIEAGPT